MPCVVVNDASCLIDIRKGGLLSELCSLPYRFIVPLPIRESEILDFHDWEWKQLDRAGMITYDLTPKEVDHALDLKRRHPALSANDCFCFVSAWIHQGILLTGDALLRRVATANGLRVHGALWIVDQLEAVGTCPRPLLIDALKCWQADDTVFLPEHEIFARLAKLSTGFRGSSGDA